MLCQAEAVVKAGRKAATVIAGAKEVVTSDIALAVLRRLSLLKSAEAAQKLEVCIASVHRCKVTGWVLSPCRN